MKLNIEIQCFTAVQCFDNFNLTRINIACLILCFRILRALGSKYITANIETEEITEKNSMLAELSRSRA